MKNLENFLNYVIDNLDDDRIHISKKVKYGCRYFIVSINLPTINSREITIIVDTRNNIIDVGYDFGQNVVVESEALTKKWSDIFEKKYTEDIDQRFDLILNDFISQTDKTGKDFWRDWTMKKIFKSKNKKS